MRKQSMRSSFGIEPKRTRFCSLWQNGVAERWVGACRWDLLDHVIVLNKRHLRRLMNEYFRLAPGEEYACRL
jgi:transposase InsO family protein